MNICTTCQQLKHIDSKKSYKRKICFDCLKTKQDDAKINYRLKKSLTKQLRSVLVKNTTAMTYIGCNIQYLREWFEYNFTQVMNWNNYGSYWSIGHIIPVCQFDLTNEDDKFRCWNWSNMIPIRIALGESDLDLNSIKQKLAKFKEEGSTTKWFSGASCTEEDSSVS
jgi:hypothetical protein